MKELPVYRIIPSDMDDNYFEVAIVENPAMEVFSLLFSEEKMKFQIDTDKKEIYGPALIPNKLIYKNDNLGERYVKFDDESIKKSVKLFFRKGIKINLEHTDEKIDMDVLESYFAKEDNEFGVPAGSWILRGKINNDTFWNSIKNKKVGFSVESIFENYFTGDVLIKNNKTEMNDVKSKLIKFINEMLFEETVEAVEAVEETKEEVVEETKEVVEEIKEEVVEEIKEEVVEETKEVVEETKEVVEEENKDEEIKKYIDSKFDSIKEMIEKLNLNSELETMKKQIEEFGKQPTSKPITEDIQTLKPSEEFGYLRNIKK